MQANDMVEKKKAFWDGEEVSGLVSVSEIVRERRTVEVPSFRRIRDIQSGIEKMPELTLKYKIARSSSTLEFFESFFDKQEVKDLDIIRTDAHGVEFSRKTYTQCELKSITEPAYDAANPTYADITVVVVPYDIVAL